MTEKEQGNNDVGALVANDDDDDDNADDHHQKGTTEKKRVWSSDDDVAAAVPNMTSTERCKAVAAIRAVNSEDPSVAFVEPLAAYLAGDVWVDRIKAHKVNSIPYHTIGLINPVAFRCSLVDEETVKACDAVVDGASGIQQVVVLGAGMDTRPYRLDLPNVKWFEVDVPYMSNYKKQMMESVPTHLKEHAVLKTQSHQYVPIDLITSLSDLVPQLVEVAGLDQDAPVLYVAEGLVYYLGVDDNLRLLDALPAHHPESQALVTCIAPSWMALVQDVEVQAKVADAKQALAHWKLDSDAYAELIIKQSQSWRLERQVDMDDEATSRGFRLPYPLGFQNVKASELLLHLRTTN